MSTSASSTASRLNLWPVSIIAFFTVAIIGCGSFIAFCSRHPADLITPNYYEDEVRYQAQMERVRFTQQNAPQATAFYDAATRHIRLVLGPTAQTGKVSGSVVLFRPSAQNLDRRLDLSVDRNGEQLVDAAALLPGLWKVRVSWTGGDQQYFLDKQVVVPSVN